MKRKIVKLMEIGFLIGAAAGNIIALLLFLLGKGESRLTTPILTEEMGSDVGAFLVQTLLSGLLGAVSFAGMLFYERDDLSMLQAAVVHWLVILMTYFPIALFCGWISDDLREILLMAGILTGIYILIFLVMYLRYRKQTEDLNRELRD